MSMQDKLPNSASVSRLWSNNKTELIAIFQYSNDAEMFAISRLHQDIKGQLCNSNYVIACSYTGRITVLTRDDLPKGTP